jgi:hypothetical protein
MIDGTPSFVGLNFFFVGSQEAPHLLPTFFVPPYSLDPFQLNKLVMLKHSRLKSRAFTINAIQ